jgi:hypothetical protein
MNSFELHVVNFPNDTPLSFEYLLESKMQLCNRLEIRIQEYSKIILSENFIVKTKLVELKLVGIGENVSIESRGHSLIQCKGKNSNVYIENIELIHSYHNEDHKNIGAVVFAMHRSKVSLINCTLISKCGFALWCVQNTSVSLTDCYVSSKKRSGIVLFGNSKAYIYRCYIYGCAQHGVCLRGRCEADIRRSIISHCQVRGLYAYAAAKVIMEHCSIFSIFSDMHAAVEVYGFPYGFSRDILSCNKTKNLNDDQIPSKTWGISNRLPDDVLSLKISHCNIYDNKGIGICIRYDTGALLPSTSPKSNTENKVGDAINSFDIFLHESCINVSARELNFSYNKLDIKVIGHDNSESQLLDRSINLPSSTDCQSDKLDASPRWYYHYDDVLKTIEGGILSDIDDGMKNLWKPYNEATNSFIESSYKQYVEKSRLAYIGKFIKLSKIQ